jgi:hypothetical protein
LDWTTVLVAFIGIGGILLAQHMTNQSEKGQRAHQERLKENELEEAKQQRLRDERIKAYAELARLVYARETTEEDISVAAEMLAVYSAITLVGESSETILAAKSLCRKTVELRDLAQEVSWIDRPGGRKGTTDPAYSVADAAVQEAYKDFVIAVRKEIGHPREATESIELMD